MFKFQLCCRQFVWAFRKILYYHRVTLASNYFWVYVSTIELNVKIRGLRYLPHLGVMEAREISLPTPSLESQSSITIHTTKYIISTIIDQLESN